MDVIVILLLILFLIGFFPAWPHMASFGYFPFGTILLIVIVLVLLRSAGRI